MKQQKLAYRYMRLLSRIPLVRFFVTFYRNLLFKEIPDKFIPQEEVIYLKDNANISSIVNDLKVKGISTTLAIKNSDVKKIIDFFSKEPVFALRDPSKGFYLQDKLEFEKKLGKEILLAQYYNIENHDVVKAIANSIILEDIAKKYLGRAVYKVGTIMWWTFPANVSQAEKNKHAHVFHRDIDDYKFLKFFFYLTDVAAGDGSHVYVTNSHAPGYLDLIREGFRVKRYNDEQIKHRYGDNNILELVGNSGIGFAEDTTGFHKANTPINNPRLLLEVTFAQHDYGVMHDIVSKNEFIIFNT